MLMTVAEFTKRVRSEPDDLVKSLQAVTGRSGEEEAQAWRSSLPALTNLLASPALSQFHIFFGGLGNISLEYQLPAASAWCDAVLLGSNDGRASAVVIELKHWSISGDGPGESEGLILRNGTPRLHPSKQVAGYTDYIRRFHSAVQQHDATVNGCVFFTRTGSAKPYLQAPNHLLATNYPIFTTSVSDVELAFPNYLSAMLKEPSKQFAESFENGTYKQDRGFVKQIGAQILDPRSKPFVLLDNQEEALLLCRQRISSAIDRRDGAPRKHVVIVRGPPGSGKSVVAARLWASLVTDRMLADGNVVITTTSASQSSNWSFLVDRAANLEAASGIVKKATSYHPITTAALGSLRKKQGMPDLFSDASRWRDNFAALRKLHKFQAGAEDDAYLVSLVDEAHALINPEHVSGRGQFGFVGGVGPQAFHIIRASRLSVFFIDPDQGFRERENTTVPDIRLWAAECGASVDEIDLSATQFRCAGSKEYVEWIDILRSCSHPRFAGTFASRWRNRSPMALPASSQLMVAEEMAFYGSVRRRGGMQFEIAHDPFELELKLRGAIQQGHSCRILASYHRPWKTKDAQVPHELPHSLQDFSISTQSKGVWARPWNFVPEGRGDYTLFVQAATNSRMAGDPLCEVGCPYAVRGFDYDYVAVLWGLDLVWRTDRWIVQPEHVFETGIAALMRKAKREASADRPANQELLNRVWQSYRILLTRAMRGCVLWVEDSETKSYLTQAASL